MTKNQFVTKAVAHILHVEITGLAANLRIKGYMKQHIAQFLADVLLVILHQGITKFVGFFYGVWSQTIIGLFAVPRTFFTEFIQHVEEASEGFHLFFSCMHTVLIIKGGNYLPIIHFIQFNS